MVHFVNFVDDEIFPLSSEFILELDTMYLHRFPHGNLKFARIVEFSLQNNHLRRRRVSRSRPIVWRFHSKTTAHPSK